MRQLLRSILLVFWGTCLFAQHQRVAFRFDPLEVRPRSLSKPIQALCLDRDLFATTIPTQYQNVLGGSAPAFVTVGTHKFSLAEAIRQGIVTMWVNELTVRFANNISEPIQLSATGPIAGGEKPGSVDTPNVFAALSREISPLDHKAQRQAWDAAFAARALRVLGFLDEGQFDEVNWGLAVSKFQQQAGIDQDGRLGPVTDRALHERLTLVSDQLRRIGFPIPEERLFNYPDLSDAVRDYQTMLGLAETGRLDATLERRITRDSERLNEIDGLQNADIPGRYLANAPDLSLLTYHTSGDRVMALFLEEGRPELWVKTREGIAFRGRSDAATLVWEAELAAESRKYQQLGATFLCLGVGLSPEDVRIFSGTRWLSVRREEFESFIAGDGTTPEWINELVSGVRSSQPLIVLRDERFQGRGGDAGGSALQDAMFQLPDPFALAKALSRVVPSEVYVANDFVTATSNLHRLPAVSDGSGLWIVRDSSLEDKGTTYNTEADLKEAKLQIIEPGEAGVGKPSVVFFAGNNSPGFRKMLLERAAKREFAGSILALAVCGKCGLSAFNSEVIRTSGARAVVFYDQEINPTAVQKVMVEFANLLTTEDPNGDFYLLWKKSVEAAIRHNDSPEMTKHFEKLRQVLVQLSLLQSTNQSVNAE